MNMNEGKATSLNSLREELSKLDTQIEMAKNLQEILSEEKKPIYSVYKWDAPERVFEVKDKKWYLIISSISMFLIILGLLTENYGFVAAIIALVILLYALNNVPPTKVTHEITNKGISIYSKLHVWKDIERFWISKRGENAFLNLEVRVKKGDMDQIIVFIGEGDTKTIVSYLSQFVDYVSQSEVNNSYFNRLIFGEIQSLSSFLE